VGGIAQQRLNEVVANAATGSSHKNPFRDIAFKSLNQIRHRAAREKHLLLEIITRLLHSLKIGNEATTIAKDSHAKDSTSEWFQRIIQRHHSN